MSIKRPTLKQREAFKNALENGGNVTQAMKKAGYKLATINNPKNLIESDGWQLLMDAYLPDEVLAKKLEEGLGSTRTISANVVVKSDDPKVKNKTATARDVDFIDVPDYMARHKYLETALKLKKRLNDKSEDAPTNTTTVIGFKFVFPTKPNESD